MAGPLGATAYSTESATGAAHREAHLFQVGLHLLALIALDFHPALLQCAAGCAMGFQFLDQSGEVIRVRWQVEHDGDGFSAAPLLVKAQVQPDIRRDNLRRRDDIRLRRTDAGMPTA